MGRSAMAAERASGGHKLEHKYPSDALMVRHLVRELDAALVQRQNVLTHLSARDGGAPSDLDPPTVRAALDRQLTGLLLRLERLVPPERPAR
jgi:hypothetical protein